MFPGSQNRRLLILDDDHEVNFTIGEIARRAGFKTFSTTQANEFFQTVVSWEPTHLVVDLVMPDMDGIDVIKRLADYRNVGEIIIVSGLGARVLEAAARTATEHGLRVAGVLAKPFSPAKLSALLNAEQLPDNKQLGEDHSTVLEPDITEHSIRDGLDRNEFKVHFQPKLSCTSGTVVGFECLVRWDHPDFGIIMPDRFIPVAEDNNLIDALTKYIFVRALSWFAASFLESDMKIAVNISAKTFSNPDFPEWIVKQCEKLNISPRQVVLEITETTSMQNPISALEILTQFRIKGFSLSIDDFGVGFSSLVQLARFPFSEMKIEKMFVISANHSGESQKIITAIVGLARALGMSVTAEGVEDQWTLEFLREVGCDYVQGYHFTAAMTGEDTLQWLQTRTGNRPSWEQKIAELQIHKSRD